MCLTSVIYKKYTIVEIQGGFLVCLILGLMVIFGPPIGHLVFKIRPSGFGLMDPPCFLCNVKGPLHERFEVTVKRSVERVALTAR